MGTRFLGHTDKIGRITVGDKHIHSGSNDKTVRIWDKASGECTRILGRFNYIPIHAADSRFIYVMAWADLLVFDTRSGEKIAEMRLPTTQDLQAIVQDDTRLFISARDGKLFVIGKGSLTLTHTIDTDGSSWALTCGARHLYLSALDGSIAVWDLATLSPVGVLTGHKGNIQRLHADDRYLYSLSADRSLAVWRQESGTMVKRMPKVFARSMIGIVSDDRYLYLANGEEGLKVIEKESWQLVGARPDLHVIYGKGMAVDAEHLYLGLNDFSIEAFDKRPGPVVARHSPVAEH